jgi:hypothetical protein
MGNWTGIVGALSGSADAVVTDLQAFGSISPQSAAGGHATVQTATTVAKADVAAFNGLTGYNSITNSTWGEVGIAVAAIVLVFGIYLLLHDHKSRPSG